MRLAVRKIEAVAEGFRRRIVPPVKKFLVESVELPRDFAGHSGMNRNFSWLHRALFGGDRGRPGREGASLMRVRRRVGTVAGMRVVRFG